jgi:hypothetical protein
MKHRRSWRCVSRGRAGARHARRTRCREDPELPRDTSGVIARLAELGDRLGGQPRPEFRARLRETLLSAHEEARRAAAERLGAHDAAPATSGVPAGAGPEPPPRAPLLVRLRPVALALALVLVAAGTGYGAHHAVPGDLLYPLKRASESALITMSIDETARAERELDTAHSRATEAAALARAPARERRERLLEATIDEMTASTRSALTRLSRVKRRDGQRSGSNGKLRRFAKEQRNVVEPLIPALNGSSKEKANAYLHLLRGFETP